MELSPSKKNISTWSYSYLAIGLGFSFLGPALHCEDWEGSPTPSLLAEDHPFFPCRSSEERLAALDDFKVRKIRLGLQTAVGKRSSMIAGRQGDLLGWAANTSIFECFRCL